MPFSDIYMDDFDYYDSYDGYGDYGYGDSEMMEGINSVM